MFSSGIVHLVLVGRMIDQRRRVYEAELLFDFIFDEMVLLGVSQSGIQGDGVQSLNRGPFDGVELFAPVVCVSIVGVFAVDGHRDSDQDFGAFGQCPLIARRSVFPVAAVGGEISDSDLLAVQFLDVFVVAPPRGFGELIEIQVRGNVKPQGVIDEFSFRRRALTIHKGDVVAASTWGELHGVSMARQKFGGDPSLQGVDDGIPSFL